VATFSAALLAGGKSSRMGRDKALLPMPGFDFLWQRQLRELGELEPARLFWSGGRREGLPPHLIVVEDAVEDAGPLGGVGACLEVLESDLLVVLAVDLPRMTASFLANLLSRCAATRGAVPLGKAGSEPLAAIYPKAILPLARKHLATGKVAMRDFVAAGEKAGLLRLAPIGEEERPLFQNVNTPGDLDALNR
jgi:molybdopterin-guanine dinucleotide biosynthesis protein A